VFYFFFAVFPTRSPVDLRVPWLKWFMLIASAAVAVPLSASLLFAGTVEVLWRIVDRFPATPAIFGTYGCLGLGLGLLSLVWSSRRAPTNEARRRTRVILWGTIAATVPVVLLDLIAYYLHRSFYSFPFWIWQPAVGALFLLPLSFAYAVIKHRVLEVPLLLKRSARYLLVQRGFIVLLLTLAIAATMLFAVAFGRLFSAEPHLAVPISAGFGILLAWAGTYSRRHVTRRIDRAFFRSAYDARQILEDLAEKARTATAREELAGLLDGCLEQALHPTFLLVYLESDGGFLRARGSVPPELENLPRTLPWIERLAQSGRPMDALAPEPDEPTTSPLRPLQPDCLVPMLGREARMLGLVALGPRLSEEPYSGEDKRLLASVATQAGIALENISLAETMAERLEAERRTAREMEIAREVQQQLFPQRVLPLDTLDYAGVCIQARFVGGDYYDFVNLGPGRIGLVVADISGKGMAAALLMANLQANLRSQYALAVEDLPRLFQSVNDSFYASTARNRFATLFFARYEDATREVTFVNCGHNPPILLRCNGSVERLNPTAAALGLFAEWTCSSARLTLASGDTLVIFSDGVTEAWSEEDEEFGETRLLSALHAHRHLPPAALLEATVADVQRFSGHDQADDLTMIVARARISPQSPQGL
jgi:sigma-B regulation protein RsbU (phosphoserine phosphatase)